MASSSTTGASSGSMSSDQEDQQQLQLVDQRKRKRMLSNRESARRSRIKKQKHLDDLVSQAGHLKKDNGQIMTSIRVTTQMLVNLEAENSILRAQMGELTNRLQSLNEIINCISSTANCLYDHEIRDDYDTQMMINLNDVMMNPWNSLLNQPIIASAHDQMYMYWLIHKGSIFLELFRLVV